MQKSAFIFPVIPVGAITCNNEKMSLEMALLFNEAFTHWVIISVLLITSRNGFLNSVLLTAECKRLLKLSVPSQYSNLGDSASVMLELG